MRVWKRSILLFVGISVLLLSTLTVSAESDNTGDVWHQAYSEDNWTWEAYTGSKRNIDITDVSYTITGLKATLTMTVDGSIETSDKIFYWMSMTPDDGTGYYWAWYTQDESYYIGYGGYLGSGGELVNPVSGNTFTATFNITDPDATYTVYGWAIESKTAGDESGSGESWWDYAPNTYAPWYGLGSGSSGSKGGTPGFEIIAVITALAIALIILRRRK